jgi:hypothetical protein
VFVRFCKSVTAECYKATQRPASMQFIQDDASVSVTGSVGTSSDLKSTRHHRVSVSDALRAREEEKRKIAEESNSGSNFPTDDVEHIRHHYEKVSLM